MYGIFTIDLPYTIIKCRLVDGFNPFEKKLVKLEISQVCRDENKKIFHPVGKYTMFSSLFKKIDANQIRILPQSWLSDYLETCGCGRERGCGGIKLVDSNSITMVFVAT